MSKHLGNGVHMKNVPSFDLGPALLFCPGDRPDRYQKAIDRADAVIIDLEDAVALDDKPAAREALVANQQDPERTIVRLNSVASGELDADLSALAMTDYRNVMLPKCESADDVGVVAGVAKCHVIPLCETPKGVLNAQEIVAAKGVCAVMWGAEDLVAETGGYSSRGPDGQYRDLPRFARSAVLLAASAHGKAAIDAVHLDFRDADGMRGKAEDAAAVGFAASACLHPDQVPIVRAAYTPPADRVAWAEQVLAAAEEHRGVFSFEGRMVDEPVLAQARRLLARG
ncbi:MAG: HpcH/HpaI aldolase/citrate lyase family protein [Beutenbergiaceae bacterium]